MIPAEVSCTPGMISRSHFSFLAIKASPHYHSSTEKNILRSGFSLSQSIFLAYILFKSIVWDNCTNLPRQSQLVTAMCFIKDRERPHSPPCPHIGLNHCSFLCCIYPFAICQTPLQNLPLFLPQEIIFSFLAPYGLSFSFPMSIENLPFPPQSIRLKFHLPLLWFSFSIWVV